MVNQNYGRIALVPSTAGLFGMPNQANYAAAKMGVVGLALALHTEIGNRNVCWYLISPLSATNLPVEAIIPELRTMLEPEFVAPMVIYFCSPECKQSGNIYVAGGGYFTRTGLFEENGVFIEPGEIKVESIAEKIDEISDLKKCDTYFICSPGWEKIFRRAFCPLSKGEGKADRQ